MFKDIICCCVIDEFTNLMLLMRCNRIRNIDNTGQIVLREVTMQYTPPSYILEHMKKHKEILGDNLSTQTLVTLILNYFYTTNQDLTKVKINYSKRDNYDNRTKNFYTDVPRCDFYSEDKV